MTLFINELKASGVEDDQIIRINFEDYDAIELTAPKALHAYLKSKLQPGRTVYFFLDEIQNVGDFHRVIDSLYIRDNADIYLTGSNSTMLSSDLASLLTGRYVEIKMLPMSFSEFVEGTHAKGSLSENYRHYLEVGSFPYALSLPNAEAVRIYYEGVFNTILLKDLTLRLKLSDTSLLVSICRFLFENIGSLVAPKRIADYLNAHGRKCDVKTVDKYLNALMDCFVLYEARRFDIHGTARLSWLVWKNTIWLTLDFVEQCLVTRRWMLVICWRTWSISNCYAVAMRYMSDASNRRKWISLPNQLMGINTFRYLQP